MHEMYYVKIAAVNVRDSGFLQKEGLFPLPIRRYFRYLTNKAFDHSLKGSKVAGGKSLINTNR